MFNKIKEVFTKEYRDEIKYRELLEQNINCFKFVSPLKEESVNESNSYKSTELKFWD